MGENEQQEDTHGCGVAGLFPGVGGKCQDCRATKRAWPLGMQQILISSFGTSDSETWQYIEITLRALRKILVTGFQPQRSCFNWFGRGFGYWMV